MNLNSLFLALLFLTGFLLNSCSGPYKKHIETPIGLSKRQLLKKYGSPSESFRKKGRDYWVYESLKKAQNGEKLLYKHFYIFDEGVLIKKYFERSFSTREFKEFSEESFKKASPKARPSTPQ